MARGIGVDTAGNLFIADAENNVIRRVDASTGNISTVVGNGTIGYSGDNGYALGCNLHNPYAVAVDRYGSIYIADANNQRIRISFDPTLAVKNVTQATDIKLYPNPGTDNVSVSGLSISDKAVICDIAGRTVVNASEAQNGGIQSFNTRNLEAGMYLMQVWDAAGYKKAVINFVKE